jgi:hypothetical protein
VTAPACRARRGDEPQHGQLVALRSHGTTEHHHSAQDWTTVSSLTPQLRNRVTPRADPPGRPHPIPWLGHHDLCSIDHNTNPVCDSGRFHGAGDEITVSEGRRMATVGSSCLNSPDPEERYGPSVHVDGLDDRDMTVAEDRAGLAGGPVRSTGAAVFADSGCRASAGCGAALGSRYRATVAGKIETADQCRSAVSRVTVGGRRPWRPAGGIAALRD